MTLSVVSGFRTRDGSVDANLVHALGDDEYRLKGRRLEGWAIDVGAYIGTVTAQLALLNPGLRVIAIEAVPDNADLLEENIGHFNLASRVTVVRAWAGGPNDLTGTCHYGYRHRATEDDGYVSAHRFVGGTWGASGEPQYSLELPAVSLDALTNELDDVALLKIDCEGCEWAFLDTPAVARVQSIVGEYHGGYPETKAHVPDPQARIRELLGDTHDIAFWMPDEKVVGLFEATRR